MKCTKPTSDDAVFAASASVSLICEPLSEEKVLSGTQSLLRQTTLRASIQNDTRKPGSMKWLKAHCQQEYRQRIPIEGKFGQSIILQLHQAPLHCLSPPVQKRNLLVQVTTKPLNCPTRDYHE